jgi:hypothetical protein
MQDKQNLAAAFIYDKSQTPLCLNPTLRNMWQNAEHSISRPHFLAHHSAAASEHAWSGTTSMDSHPLLFELRLEITFQKTKSEVPAAR